LKLLFDQWVKKNLTDQLHHQLQQEKQNTAKNPKLPNTPQEDELPTVCFAPVDKTPHVPVRGTSSCPQASPVDNPAELIINKDSGKTGV
jgi:hypothetical protein